MQYGHYRYFLKSTKKYISKKTKKNTILKNTKNIMSQCLWDENTVIMLNIFGEGDSSCQYFKIHYLLFE